MENENVVYMSRRRMLQLTGAFGAGALGGATLGAGALLTGCSTSDGESGESQSTQKTTSTTLSVYDPSGSIEITQVFATRLDNLENKTIAFVSDDAWEDVRTFALMQELFAEKYPNTTIITADNFIHGIDAITQADNGLPEAMQEKGVDAVIVGNAG